MKFFLYRLEIGFCEKGGKEKYQKALRVATLVEWRARECRCKDERIFLIPKIRNDVGFH